MFFSLFKEYHVRYLSVPLLQRGRYGRFFILTVLNSDDFLKCLLWGREGRGRETTGQEGKGSDGTEGGGKGEDRREWGVGSKNKKFHLPLIL